MPAVSSKMLPLWLNPEPPDADAVVGAHSVNSRFGEDGAGDAVVEIGLGVDLGSARRKARSRRRRGGCFQTSTAPQQLPVLSST